MTRAASGACRSGRGEYVESVESAERGPGFKSSVLSAENQRMNHRLVFALSIAFLAAFVVPSSAEGPEPGAVNEAANEAARQTASSRSDSVKPASLPDTYRSVALGMDMETVKEKLAADGMFGYRGDRDVSLLPFANRSLIETVGPSFIRRSWFQFLENKLYVMIFNLDPERVDYYSVYSSFVAKYGEPKSIDPARAVWSDDRVTLSLERPLTVKYVDAAAFKSLLDADTTDKAASDILREEFIREF